MLFSSSVSPSIMMVASRFSQQTLAFSAAGFMVTSTSQ
jgi:hypothetical protein